MYNELKLFNRENGKKHDKKLRDAFFLGEYKSYEDAENNVNYDVAYKIK